MIAGVVTIASAPAASAATITVTVNCDGDVWVGTPAAGDTLEITLGGDCTEGTTLYNFYGQVLGDNLPGFLDIGGSSGNCPGVSGWDALNGDCPDGRWEYATTGAGPWTIAPLLLAFGGEDPVNGPTLAQGVQLAEVNFGGSVFALRYGSESNASAGSPIPQWVQGYGRTGADEACLEGWDASWAQWMNDGTGGFVCQRSVSAIG